MTSFDHDWNDTSIIPTSGEEVEEQGFTFTATITMEVMDTSRENAKAWFEDHLADIIDQRYQLDVVIEDA